MAEQLLVSEGHIVSASGERIASLNDLGASEQFTILENRIAALENAMAEHLEEHAAAEAEPEDPNAPSPPGGPLKIHVTPDETPTGQPVPTPIGVSSPGSPANVAGIPEATP
jgi:hypothetical protein